MAVSSTNNNSSLGASAIDVAGIVDQLMTVENRPLEKLKSQIEQKKLLISDLGTIRSKIAIFQDALKVLENPTTFNNSAASSSDATVVSATAGNGAIKGNHLVSVTKLATATRHIVSGYTSASDKATIDSVTGFAITIAGVTYNTNGDKTVSGVTTKNSVTVLNGNPSITELKDWINGLGAEIRASVTQTTADNKWILTIEGAKTGSSNAISFPNDSPALTGLIGVPSQLTNSSTQAFDAEFTVNGTLFKRTSNTISDVINQVTLNLSKIGSANINVTKGDDISSEAINTLVAAYNDVMNTYKAMTANSSNSDKPGNFANSPSTLSFINQIKEGFARGISYIANGAPKTMSLSALGIDLQLDGTAKFNSTSFALASASGLRDILALGVKMGVNDSTKPETFALSNLDTFINAQVKAGGLLSGQINSETEAVRSLTKRQDDLQIRLNSIQNNLIAQYSALNALLFQLSSTSNSLTSALDALTNSQKNN